jgi:hypothetical protein
VHLNFASMSAITRTDALLWLADMAILEACRCNPPWVTTHDPQTNKH